MLEEVEEDEVEEEKPVEIESIEVEKNGSHSNFESEQNRKRNLKKYPMIQS